MPQTRGGAFVGFGSAIGFVGTIQRAAKIALRGPLDIVGDRQIQLAIAIVIDPGGAGAELLDACKTGVCRYIRKRTVAIVVKQTVLPQTSHKDVIVTIIVVVTDGRPHSIDTDGQAGFRSNVGEGPVMVIVIQLECGG